MPWTTADVDRHKKGLSDKQKAQWVAVANSVLAKCIKDGGTDATCAPSAIRQANGVVGNAEYFFTYKSKQPAYTAETRQLNGVNHLVVPTVMMVEGVHNGSHGPLFQSIEELGRFPNAWDGRPIVIDHPEVEGHYISANSPEIIEQRKLGTVFNTHVVGSKLMAELWLEEEKLRQMSAEVLACIQRGDPLEISLGMFSEEDPTPGVWNGESYNAIAKNHRPDHLALLPGGRGACSIADGCGVRANNENKKGGSDVTKEEWVQSMNDLKEAHYTDLINSNIDQGYKALVDAARQKLDSMDANDSIHYLQEVYPEFLVYEVRQRVGGTKLYKQAYEFNGNVELKGSPVEVRRKVEFVTMAEGSGLVRTKFNNNVNKEEQKMADNAEKCLPCVKAKVDALIAHASKKFVETDREWLEALSEAQLDKLVPTVIEKEVTKEVNVLTDAQKAALAYGEKMLKERREKLIKGIQTNAKDVWTDAELADMSEAVLEKVFVSVNKVKVEEIDYSVTGQSNLQVNESKEAPLALTGMKFKTK